MLHKGTTFHESFAGCLDPINGESDFTGLKCILGTTIFKNSYSDSNGQLQLRNTALANCQSILYFIRSNN